MSFHALLRVLISSKGALHPLFQSQIYLIITICSPISSLAKDTEVSTVVYTVYIQHLNI